MTLKGAFSQSTGILAALSLALAGCGGGDTGSGVGGSPTPTPTPSPSAGRVFSAPAQVSLSSADVQKVIAQAVGEAKARNLPSVIAVTDRVGNVLAVFRMNGARATMLTSKLTGANTINATPQDAQGLTLPAELGAIAKAITGAYLSSSGNAFSTRTASEIVQQHFPPAPSTPGLESGPLFGVQFSQLPCSDLNSRFVSGASSYRDAVTGAEVTSVGRIGPQRSPLGLAADPGGLPLYKNGVVVGAIGVMGDGDYGFDTNVLDIDTDAEEFIALAGIQGFAPPDEILADRITADGTTLRFSDAKIDGLSALQTNFAAINGVEGTLIPVAGYFDGAIVPGTAYGSEASGYRYATSAEFSNPDAYVLTNGSGVDRFPLRAATDGGDIAQPLTKAEATALLEEAFKIMSRARAQIRRPLDSPAQVTLSLVDTYGSVLGVVRSPDAPIFGTDVSLQKARTVMFFSSPVAAAQLNGTPGEIPQFVTRTRTFLNDPTALTGAFAFADRSVGNLARPYYPDGEVGRPNGPLSRPIDQWSPLATGLQAALIVPNLVEHVVFNAGGGGDTPHECTKVPNAPNGKKRLANGIQIFAGAVPVYRGNTLVGALGISGDGIDQDDMIAFLGTNNGSARAGGGLGNAPKAIRADNIVVNVGSGVRLRYVNCPFAPFLDTATQNACEGL